MTQELVVIKLKIFTGKNPNKATSGPKCCYYSYAVIHSLTGLNKAKMFAIQ